MGVVLVATIGFTVDFVMRRVADLGRGSVSRVIALGIHVGDEAAWRRVEQAFKLLSGYLSGLGIDSELARVRLGPGMVRSIRDALARASSLAGPDGTVEAYLTGGPRILVAATIIAAMTSTPEVRDRLRIVVYGEGFEGALNLQVGPIVEYLKLRGGEARIIEEIARLGEATAAQLLGVLGVKRSTLYKKLAELEARGLLRRDGRGWRVHETLEAIL